MQPIRVGNQPILDGNQGAGIRFRGGRCYPAAAYQPIRVGNPAGCYADAAHPPSAISPTLTATRARESGFGGALLSRGGNQPIPDGNQPIRRVDPLSTRLSDMPMLAVVVAGWPCLAREKAYPFQCPMTGFAICTGLRLPSSGFGSSPAYVASRQAGFIVASSQLSSGLCPSLCNADMPSSIARHSRVALNPVCPGALPPAAINRLLFYLFPQAYGRSSAISLSLTATGRQSGFGGR